MKTDDYVRDRMSICLFVFTPLLLVGTFFYSFGQVNQEENRFTPEKYNELKADSAIARSINRACYDIKRNIASSYDIGVLVPGSHYIKEVSDFQDKFEKEAESFTKKFSKKKGVDYKIAKLTPSKNKFTIVPASMEALYQRMTREEEQEIEHLLTTQKQDSINRRVRPSYKEQIYNNKIITEEVIARFDTFFVTRNKQRPLYEQVLSNGENLQGPISKYAYPYFGNVEIKMIDASNNIVGSYEYVYDTKVARSEFDLYRPQYLKASVTTEKKVNRYDLYCDGKKVGTKTYERELNNTTYEDGSLAGTILMSLARGIFDNVNVHSVEKKLVMETQINQCYYRLDPKLRKPETAKSNYDKAIIEVSKGNYPEAIVLLDVAIMIDNDVPVFYELSGDILSNLDYKDWAIFYYFETLKKLRDKNNANLGELYRKIAICIAKIQNPDHMVINYSVAYPDNALIYIRKAAQSGDLASSEMCKKAKSDTELLRYLKNL